jgi:hypothetical protein
MAVGEKNGAGEPPSGGQCELLNSSNATTGGTRNHGPETTRAALRGIQRSPRASVSHPDPSAMPAGGPCAAHFRSPKTNRRSQTAAKYFLTRHRYGNTCHGSSRGGESAAVKAAKRGTPSHASWLSHALQPDEAAGDNDASSLSSSAQMALMDLDMDSPLPCYRFDSLWRSVGGGLGANECPIGIWAKPLARHASKALNGWTSLCRHLALTIAPEARSLGRNANGSGKPRHAGKSGNGLLNCIHAQNSTLVDHINLQVCL